MPVRGVSGNRPLWGIMETGEYIQELDGASGQALFNRMRRSDGQIAAVLKAITLPVVRNQYTVEPASDDPRDVEIAEFVQDNLHNRLSMTWRDTLRHILLMEPHGFMVMEKLFERSRVDGLVRLRKLDPRLPWSIDRWNYESDTLVSLEQVGSDGRRYVLPIDKLVVFTNNREGDNWEGVSVLRPVYGYWKIKNTMLEISAIKHERYGVGIPVAYQPESVDQGAVDKMDELLEELHADEAGFLNVPYGWKVEMLKMASNEGTDSEEFVDKLDHKIATAMLAQFLQLGTTDSGNRALGESFIGFFLLTLQELADYIADVMTRFVVHELVDYNWDVEDYPVLRAARIEEIDNQALAALTTAGVIRHDAELENTVRRQLGLPELEVNEEERDERATSGDDPSTEDDVEDEAPEEAPDDVDDADDVEAHDRHGHLHTFAQDLPERAAVVMSPELMSDELDTATESTLEKVLRVRDIQLDRVVTQIVGGRRIREITVPAKKDMYDAVVAAFRDQVKVGREQVRSEIQNQRPDVELADPISDDQFIELTLEELSLRVDGAGEKLKAMVGELALELRKAGFAGDALRAELDRVLRERMSDVTWRTLSAAAVNQGWGLGRAQELQRVTEDEVDYYYRSAILDSNLCSICRPKDGMTVTPDMPEFRVPDQECEGGPSRCRCLVVAVMKSEGRET